MKKLINVFFTIVVMAFSSCSNDDDSSNADAEAEKICETCTNSKGEQMELCDNGDGTFTRTTTLSSGDEDVDTFTLKQLQDVNLGTFELWVETNCSQTQ
ncbi:MAG: hypothetical protein AAFU74_09155 [Bacteroidota bacterium]